MPWDDGNLPLRLVGFLESAAVAGYNWAGYGIQPSDPTFAASQSGIGADTQNAVLLAGFLDRPLDTQGGATLAQTYEKLVSETTQGAAVSRAVADGFRAFQQTLQGQKLAISGVSLDEEAINMITYQRMFQASARYIATLTELLDILVNL